MTRQKSKRVKALDCLVYLRVGDGNVVIRGCRKTGWNYWRVCYDESYR